MIALWSLFNKHRSDAGGLWIDVMMNMIGLAMISATIAGSVYLWLRKSIGAVAVRDPDLTLVQSCAGALWWLGVIIKFNSVKRMDRPLLESCNFVNFTLCHGFGFGVWAACVAFRLLRMYMIFERKSEFLKLGASIKLHVRRDKWKILAILWAPLALLWCFFMPAVGGSELIQLGRGSGERSYTTCIYSSFLWTFLDTIAVIGVWVLLIAAAHSMKDLDDGVGENKAIKKSIDFAVGALLILIFVEIFQLDGIWIGRTVVSLSVAASILLFFVAMNGACVWREGFSAACESVKDLCQCVLPCSSSSSYPPLSSPLSSPTQHPSCVA